MEKFYLHHVLLCVDDLDRSRRFYRDTLELEETTRPTFDYPGLWFNIGNGQTSIHILVRSDATIRRGGTNDPYDVHLALRVKSYRETLAWLHSKGYDEKLPDNDLKGIQVRPDSVTGYPQIYILDPDRNIIEFNCEKMD
jgi:glyoxylase I family protein